MPIQPTYPGVYIGEIPSGVRTITGVATSITAFIGRTLRGPTDEPVTINSFSDFERNFGGLWLKSKLSFAVRDYYLNGGSQAIIVRLYHPSRTDAERETARQAAQAVAHAVHIAAKKAETDPTVTRDSVVNAAEAKNADYANGDAVAREAAVFVFNAVKNAPLGTSPESVRDSAQKKADTFEDTPASDEANRVAVAARDEAAKTDATADGVAAAALGEAKHVGSDCDLASAAAEATAVAAERAADDVVKDEARKKADGYVAEPAKSAADRVAQAAQGGNRDEARTEAVKVKTELTEGKNAANAVAQAAKAESAKNVSALEAAADDALALAASASKARIQADTLGFEAACEGAWGNALRVRVDEDVSEVSDEDKAQGLTKNDFFNLTVYDGNTGATEIFRNVTAKDSSRRIDQVLNTESKLLRVRNPVTTRPLSNAAVTPSLKLWEDNLTNYYVTPDKASDGMALTGMDITKGLSALDKADLFNLLCIPYLADQNNVDSYINAATAYCLKRRALLLIDAPSSWSNKDAAKGGKDIGSPHPNAAVFFPRLREPNPLQKGRLEDFVPCGAVAGVFARTDSQRGIWKAPAGLDATLMGVPDLTVSLTDEDNGELNPLGINCLRAMPAAGRVIWGARTRVGADRLGSEWKYISVRRTALYIEESLYRGTQWVVFEPNDEPLWGQIRVNIGAFMHSLFRQGAFQGQTPKDAYFVKCDRETTTPDDINRGMVNILVGFAPLKPAEFVMISLQQMAGQVQA